MLKRYAFTLVELLVVVAIISVLAAMLLPTLADAVEQGRRTVCANNQKQLYVALASYAAEYADFMPATGEGRADRPTNLEGMGRGYSMFVWADAYVGAKISFGATNTWSSYYSKFANPLVRGAFQCPGSRMVADGNINVAGYGPYSRRVEAYPTAVDYRLTFAPPVCMNYLGYNDTSGPAENLMMHTRLERAARPVSGFKKAFFFDNLWIASVYDPGGPYSSYYNGHGCNSQQGQNVCAGDGALKWHDYYPETTAAFGHPYTRIPNMYWAASFWANNRPISSPARGYINVYDPTRKAGYTPHDGDTWPFAGAYQYYTSLWK